MKLAYRLLLVVGHTLGDLALPVMRRQCERVGASMETLSPSQAERMIPALERVLEAYLAKPSDLKVIDHELRLEVGAERFERGEVAPGRVQGASVPRVGGAPQSAAPTADPPEHERPNGH